MTARSPRSSQGRRSVADAELTRARLVELAAELFAANGYLQTSIRDLARHGAVTSGAIYGHFRNKAELLAEAISAGMTAQLEAGSLGVQRETDFVDTLERQARRMRRRRQLRSLLVQGAAAAMTDEETRARLAGEQRAHIRVWVAAYQRNRERLGIDPDLDMETAVLYTWAVELGLGVLEGFGIEPRSPSLWADLHSRTARSWRIAPTE